MSFNPPDRMSLGDVMAFVRRHVEAVIKNDPYNPGEHLDSGMRSALAIAKIVQERDEALAEAARLRPLCDAERRAWILAEVAKSLAWALAREKSRYLDPLTDAAELARDAVHYIKTYTERAERAFTTKICIDAARARGET